MFYDFWSDEDLHGENLSGISVVRPTQGYDTCFSYIASRQPALKWKQQDTKSKLKETKMSLKDNEGNYSDIQKHYSDAKGHCFYTKDIILSLSHTRRH